MEDVKDMKDAPSDINSSSGPVTWETCASRHCPRSMLDCYDSTEIQVTALLTDLFDRLLETKKYDCCCPALYQPHRSRSRWTVTSYAMQPRAQPTLSWTLRRHLLVLGLEAVDVDDAARDALAGPPGARRGADGDEGRRVLAREPDATVGQGPRGAPQCPARRARGPWGS